MLRSKKQVALLLLFAFVYALCTAAFGAYLDIYDTGRINDSPVAGFVGGMAMGCLVFCLEAWIHRRYGSLPNSWVGYLLRHAAQGIFFVGIGFFVIGLCYVPLLAPFGMLAGIVTGTVWRLTTHAEL